MERFIGSFLEYHCHSRVKGIKEKGKSEQTYLLWENNSIFTLIKSRSQPIRG